MYIPFPMSFFFLHGILSLYFSALPFFLTLQIPFPSLYLHSSSLSSFLFHHPTRHLSSSMIHSISALSGLLSSTQLSLSYLPLYLNIFSLSLSVSPHPFFSSIFFSLSPFILSYSHPYLPLSPLSLFLNRSTSLFLTLLILDSVILPSILSLYSLSFAFYVPSLPFSLLVGIPFLSFPYFPLLSPSLFLSLLLPPPLFSKYSTNN